MPNKAAWDAYDHLNGVLADLAYPIVTEADEPRSTYLDLDDAVLGAIAEHLSVAVEDAEENVCQVVRATLVTAHPRRIFDEHERRRRDWARDPDRRNAPLHTVPPHLALLGVFSLAAADMGGGDGSPNAYYRHLAERLGLTGSSASFEQAFRDAIHPFWEAVNNWLSDCDGERGLATAYPTGGMPYIGVPISQVLVRAVDRRHLPALFSQLNLAAGDVIATDDMLRMLEGCFDDYLTGSRQHFSRNFFANWKRDGSREAIAEIFCRALETWIPEDPTPADRRGARGPRLRLIVTLETYPHPEVHIHFGCRLPASSSEPDLGFPLERLSSTLWRVPDSGGRGAGESDGMRSAVEDLGQALDGNVRASDGAIRRMPRRLVPLLLDDATRTYVETDTGQRGLRMCFLCREDLAEEFKRAIALILERPIGAEYTVASIDGLPNGWVLFSGVYLAQGLGSAAGAWSLEIHDVLGRVAEVSSRAVLEEGVQIPNTGGRGLSTLGPLVVAIRDGGASGAGILEAEVLRTRSFASSDLTRVGAASSPDHALSIDLAGLGLDDGDYEVVWRRSGQTTSSRSLRFSLRSAAIVRPPDEPRLVRSLARAGGISSNRSSGADVATLSGAFMAGVPGGDVRVVPATASLGEPRWWRSVEAPPPDASPVLEVRPVERPCLMGSHHSVFPSRSEGLTPYIVGFCKHCETRVFGARYSSGAMPKAWEKIKKLISS